MNQDTQLPHHKVKYTKQRSFGGQRSRYDSSDTIIAHVEIPSETPEEYDFPFIRETTVSSALEPESVYHDVLASQGITIDLSSHPVWDNHVTTFSEAGKGRSDSVNTLPDKEINQYD